MRSSLALPAILIVIVLIIIFTIIFMPSGSTPSRVPSGTAPGQSSSGEPAPGSSLPSPEMKELTAPSGSSPSQSPTERSQSMTEPGNLTTQQEKTSSSLAQGLTPGGENAAPPNSAESTKTEESGNPPVAGVVQDQRGQPVVGASIQVQGGDSVASGPGGAFILRGLMEPVVTLIVSHAGYQTLTQPDVRAGLTNLVLVLVQEGVLAGRVLDQFNDPIAFANVSMRALRGIWLQETKSDAEGRFSVEKPPEGEIRVMATLEGFSDEGEGSKVVSTPAAAEVILKLTQPTFSISGRVVQRETRQGVASFHLIAVRQDESKAGENLVARSDGTGMYRFDHLKAGTYLVSSDAGENAALGLTVPLDQDYKSVRVLEWDAKNIDFEVIPGLQVNGVVVNSSRQPVAGAEVTLARVPGPKVLSSFDGHFTLRGIPFLSAQEGGQAGNLGLTSLQLYATHRQYGTGFSDPLPAAPGEPVNDVVITLQGFSSLSGSVVDTANNPVPGADVLLRDLVSGSQYEQQTQTNGAFRFTQVSTSLPPEGRLEGTHTLQVSHPAYAVLRDQVVLKPGEDRVIQLRLENGSNISGRATDVSGSPIPGVLVSVLGTQGSAASAQTDGTGLYFVTGIPAGAYDLLFRLDSNPPLTGALYQVPAGTAGADVVLQPGEWRVTGTAFDAQNRTPLTYYILNIEGNPTGPRARRFVQSRVVNTPDGTYQLTLSEPGNFRVRFTAPGYHPADRAVRIAPETMQLQYLNADLEPVQSLGNISGTFVPPPGFSLAGISVLGVQAFLTTGNDFLLPGLPSGKHDLLFYVKQNDATIGQPLGVLSSVPVSDNETTNLGPIGYQLLRVAYRNP